MPRAGLRDMYEVLGVPSDADSVHIRRVYREKIRALRVSQGPRASERLRDLTHAYTVLSNQRSRVVHDQLLRASHDPQLGDWSQLGEDGLSGWVFGIELDEAQPAAATTTRVDLIARYVAVAGFVLALILLALILVRG